MVGQSLLVGEIVDDDKKEKIKHTCFTAPGKLYLVHVIVPTLAIMAGLLLTGGRNTINN